MYCLYMLCKGILVIVPRKDPLKILKLSAQNSVAPEDRNPYTGRPNRAISGFPELPLKR